MNLEDPKNSPTDPEEEIAHLDDRVVGKAFTRSALALAIIVVAIAAGLIYARRDRPKPAEKVTRLSAPAAATPEAARIPVVKFTDVTAESGVRFVHNNGAYGEKLLPETMGGG